MPRLILPLLLAGISASTAWAEVPKVVTDIPAVHSLTALIMGDLGTPELLVSGGGDAHSYQLRPSQARALAEADLIFWIGPEMTPWMERVLETGTSAEAVGLLGTAGTVLRSYPEGEEHDDEGEGTNGGGEHPHDGTDPHAWLDPKNAMNWLGVVRDALVAADPENQAAYARNFGSAEASLIALEAELDGTLAEAKAAPIVVGHDAYGYFADRFGLIVAASIEAGDAAEPGAGHLSAVAAMLAETGVRCLFPEAGHDQRRAEMLVAGTGARLGAPLDPEGRALEPGAELYGALMRSLAQAIADCQTPG